MEEQNNNQEQLEETQAVPADEIPEAAPAAEAAVEEAPAEAAQETAAEEPAEEAPAEEAPAEPVKKATPGKMAVAIGSVILLAAILIALIVSGQKQKQEAAPAETTVPVATEAVVEATIPADGNPDDVTCKGSYSVSDEEAVAQGDVVVATIGE